MWLSGSRHQFSFGEIFLQQLGSHLSLPEQTTARRPGITRACGEQEAFKVFIHEDLAFVVFLASRITAATSDQGSTVIRHAAYHYNVYSVLQQRFSAGKLKIAELPLDNVPVVCPDNGTPHGG